MTDLAPFLRYIQPVTGRQNPRETLRIVEPVRKNQPDYAPTARLEKELATMLQRRACIFEESADDCFMEPIQGVLNVDSPLKRKFLFALHLSGPEKNKLVVTRESGPFIKPEFFPTAYSDLRPCIKSELEELIDEIIVIGPSPIHRELVYRLRSGEMVFSDSNHEIDFVSATNYFW